MITKFASILNQLELIIEKYSLTEQVSNLKESLKSVEEESNEIIENHCGVCW